MAVYQRRTLVRAPLDEVWAFHSTVDGLREVTPPWLHLRVEWIRGNDGEPDPPTLEAGTTVRLSVRPFRVGPRRAWTSRIVERERRADAAWFRDEMIEGPLPRWVHTHRFHAGGDHTVVTDRVEYVLPVVPTPPSPVGRAILGPLFAYRHRRTRARLEQASP